MLKIEKGGKKGANFPRTVYLPFLFSSYLIAVLYALNSNRFLIKNIVEAPTENNARIIFSVSENIPLGSITLPKYAKGIYISFDADAIIISVSFGLDVYIAYRNNKTWSGKVL